MIPFTSSSKTCINVSKRKEIRTVFASDRKEIDKGVQGHF